MNNPTPTGSSQPASAAYAATTPEALAQVTNASTYLPAFSARLGEFRRHTGLGVNDFGIRCGISGGQASKLFGGKANISANKLRGIFAAFPDLSADWLMNGRGQMLLSDQPHQPYQLPEGKDPVQALREVVMNSPLDHHTQQDVMVLANAIDDKMRQLKDELLALHNDYTKLTNTLIEQMKRQ